MQLFKYNIPESDIFLQKMCRQIGYDYIIPINLLTDLSYLFYLDEHKINLNKHLPAKMHSKQWEYLAFLTKITESDSNKILSPTKRALNVIKTLAPRYKLTSLDRGEIEEGYNFQLDNFEINCLETSEKERLEALVHGDRDLYAAAMKIATIVSKLKNQSNNVAKRRTVVNKLKDLTKISKSQLIRPDLFAKYVTNTLFGQQEATNKVKNTILLIDDCSTTMEEPENTLLKKVMYNALTILDNPVVVYDGRGEFHLPDKASKNLYFKKRPVFSEYYNYYRILSKYTIEYKHVVLVHDCDDFVPNQVFNSKIHLITNVSNAEWFNFIKAHNGEYITI